MTILLFFLIAGTSGCTSSRPTIRSIWEQVPSVRWTGRLLESETRAGDSNSTSEPAVAANVAVKVDSDLDTAVTKDLATNERQSKSTPDRQSSQPNLFDVDSSESQAGSDADQKKSPFDLMSESDRSDSAMERLTAALSGDSLQRQALPEHSLTALDERAQIESLLSEAKLLLDSGQLDQALETAQKAQKVGDTAHLEYSPDEERPSDLVSRIEGHREAIRLNIEPSSEDFAGPPTDPDDANRDITDDGQKGTAESKDGRGLSRIRRDLSTLFRREKKGTTTPEFENAAPVPKPPRSAPLVGTKSREQQVTRVTPPQSSDAIVMANRSVFLGPPDESTSASVESRSDREEDFPAESKLSISSSFVDMDEDSDDSANQTPGIQSRTTLLTEVGMDPDGVTSMPAELQSLESAATFQEMTLPASHRQRADQALMQEPLRDADWTIYYFVFGLCTLYAVRCYRRGAT